MAVAPESFAAEVDTTLAVYTARNSKTAIAVIEEIAKKTGIAVKVVSGKAGELAAKLEAAKAADIVVAVDGGVLKAAKQEGVLHPIENKEIPANVPACLRGKQNLWAGLSARAIVSKTRASPWEAVPGNRAFPLRIKEISLKNIFSIFPLKFF